MLLLLVPGVLMGASGEAAEAAGPVGQLPLVGVGR
jgi:hypothetical protein